MTLKTWIKRIRKAFYYKIGMRFPYSKVRVWSMRKLGYSVGESVYFPSDLIVTQNLVDDSAYLYIGNRVSIAPRVMLLAMSHANASKIKLNQFINKQKRGVIIEDDCWIGAGAIILTGVTVGKGSVVGAGSVVTKDVEPYTIVAGNPARKIKEVIVDK